MTHDGLTNPFTGKQMINEASEVGNELEITRPDMDRFAARSHQLAAKATDEGRLAEEIVAVTVKSRKEETRGRGRRGDPARHDRRGAGEAARRSAATTPPTRPATRPGVNDGAAAVVVASEEWARANGREPLARVLSYGTVTATLRAPTHRIANAESLSAREPGSDHVCVLIAIRLPNVRPVRYGRGNRDCC